MPERCAACGHGADESTRNTDDTECPCCGFDPGAGHSAAEWRRRWVECGMPWSSMAIPQPRLWDPTRQLQDFPDEEEG